MVYRKSFHKRTVSPDGKVVTESSGYVEIVENHSDGSGGVSTRVTSHSSSSSVSTSSVSSSSHNNDWQRVDD